jgi:hypothetical protein
MGAVGIHHIVRTKSAQALSLSGLQAPCWTRLVINSFAAGLVLFGQTPAPAAQPEPATSTDCRALLSRGLADLELGYRAFDQKNDQGWRRLRFRGCNPEALILIDRYLERNAAKLRENERANLNFHAAQIALADDQERRAQFYLGRSQLSSDTSQQRLDWNSYVAATYAFATRDWRSFESYYQTLAARRVPVADCSQAGRCITSDANLPAVERLRRCWGRPYRVAYYACSD